MSEYPKIMNTIDDVKQWISDSLGSGGTDGNGNLSTEIIDRVAHSIAETAPDYGKDWGEFLQNYPLLQSVSELWSSEPLGDVDKIKGEHSYEKEDTVTFRVTDDLDNIDIDKHPEIEEDSKGRYVVFNGYIFRAGETTTFILHRDWNTQEGKFFGGPWGRKRYRTSLLDDLFGSWD